MAATLLHRVEFKSPHRQTNVNAWNIKKDMFYLYQITRYDIDKEIQVEGSALKNMEFDADGRMGFNFLPCLYQMEMLLPGVEARYNCMVGDHFCDDEDLYLKKLKVTLVLDFPYGTDMDAE